MNAMVRNILGVIAGLVVSAIINMGLITIGHAIVPLPPGADVSTMEKLAETIHLFGPQNFIFVFLG